LPGDFADPAIIYEDGVFYIYATAQTSADVWYSKDFVNWRLKKLNWPTSTKIKNMWAPGIAKAKDGKFYLYYSLNSQIYAGVADAPYGPFKNLLENEAPFIKDKEFFPPKIHSIDADVFVDDDGQAYLYWGSGWGFKDGVCAAAPLNDDMKSFKAAPRIVTPKGYFEGPHMIKHKGKYYLMFSGGIYSDDTYCVGYAVGDSPLGPFRAGKNSPVLVSDPATRTHGPGHHFTLQINGRIYIIYHKHEWPLYNGNRQICIDELLFDKDGEILPVKTTLRGVALDFAKESAAQSPIKPQRVLASSEKSKDYAAANAFDGNFGTLWVAADKGDSWIFADFGRDVDIARLEPFFVNIKGPYKYKLEYAADCGAQAAAPSEIKNWQTLAEFNNAEAKEWPQLIESPFKARFLRLSIKGGSLPRYGLWELKAFAKP